MTHSTLQQLLGLIERREQLATQAAAAAQPFEARAAAVMAEIEALARPLVQIKDEGDTRLDVLGAAAVVFSRAATRKADTPALQRDWAALPAEVQGIFRFEAGVDARAMRKLDEPHAAVAAQYVSTSVGEPRMSIRRRVAAG